MRDNRIVVEKAVAKTRVVTRPRYVNLDPDVAESLDLLAAQSGRRKFDLANLLLRYALKRAKLGS